MGELLLSAFDILVVVFNAITDEENFQKLFFGVLALANVLSLMAFLVNEIKSGLEKLRNAIRGDEYRKNNNYEDKAKADESNKKEKDATVPGD